MVNMDEHESVNTETETKSSSGKKKDNYFPSKEADISKESQVELLLKDIKEAALKRVSSGRENKGKVLGDSKNETISNGQESLDDTDTKINDLSNCLGQNGNACICENLFDDLNDGKSGDKLRESENGQKDEDLSLRDENRDSAVYDNLPSDIARPFLTVEDSSFQNTDTSSYSHDISSSGTDPKGMGNSMEEKNDKKGCGDEISKDKNNLSNNGDSTDVKTETSKTPIKNGENSVCSNRIAETAENTLRSSKKIKNESETELASPSSVRDFVKLKVIQEIIQEDRKLMDFTDERILSGNVAAKRLDRMETKTDKDPTDSENDDKNSSPNFTSSISEEEDPTEEGICIIINGKRLPPASESELENLRNSKERIPTVNQEGMDPNQSNSSVNESIEGVIDVTDSVEYSGSVSDQESTSNETSISQSQSSNKTDILSAILNMTSKTGKITGASGDTPNTPTLDEKNIRPIIHNFLGQKRRKSLVRSQSLNMKSVTFSQDTVFNEDKTKRYRKERVSLRNIYRNRIANSEAYAKVNPLFEEDSDEGEGYVTTTLQRRGSFIYLGDDETSPNENTDADSSIDKSVLNFPAYMQRFLQNESSTSAAIARISVGSNSESTLSEIRTSLRDQKNNKSSSSIKSSVKSESEENPTIKVTNPPKDADPVRPIFPGYDVLIKKTIAKQQHHFFMKCALGFLFALGLLAIVAIIVYFLIIKRFNH